MVIDNIIRELEAIVGPEHVLTSPEDRWTYAHDPTHYVRAPASGR